LPLFAGFGVVLAQLVEQVMNLNILADTGSHLPICQQTAAELPEAFAGALNQRKQENGNKA
jgi:hypothetical protein